MSSRDLCISVSFLTGRYHGEEWPPSPARLFQAMVAGVMTCGYQQYAEAVEPALRWLERQSPPEIASCAVAAGTPYRIAVPNNDMDVVACEWVAGRSKNPADLRTMKAVQPVLLDGPGPHVRYTWTIAASGTEAPLESLRVAAHCLYSLGWGVDMAYADTETTCSAREEVVHRPSSRGRGLDVPMEGTYDDLTATYQRFIQRASGKGVDTWTRPSVLRTQNYSRVGDSIRPTAGFVLLQPGSDQKKAVAWQNAMKVAGWLRHAAGAALADEMEPQELEEYVQGHTDSDAKSNRISYVPLPSIYGTYGDGLIRRALVVEPPDSDGKIARLLALKLTGTELSDKTGTPVCVLGRPDASDWTFRRYVSEDRRVWRTVTPIVLHGYNASRKGVVSVSKTERLLLRAFDMAGVAEGEIQSLAFQSAPLWPGTRHASSILVPFHLNGYPRVHVEVRFRKPVRGPILAGIGRHYGIGLFAAVDAD